MVVVCPPLEEMVGNVETARIDTGILKVAIFQETWAQRFQQGTETCICSKAYTTIIISCGALKPGTISSVPLGVRRSRLPHWASL